MEASFLLLLPQYGGEARAGMLWSLALRGSEEETRELDEVKGGNFREEEESFKRKIRVSVMEQRVHRQIVN